MYDRKLLKSWAEMETWDQYLERNGAFNKYVSTEGWQYIEQKYFREVKRRIESCRKLLTEHKDARIHYTIAELYDRCDLNESADNLFKRKVRLHCIRAIKKNPDYAPQWALLAGAYAWVASIGGDFKKAVPKMEISYEATIGINLSMNLKDAQVQRRIIWLIDRALKCLKQAIELDPENESYIAKKEKYYQMQYDALKALSVP